MYLYGIVLKKTLLMDQAKEVLLEAIRMEPCLWGAWLELAHHINDRFLKNRHMLILLCISINLVCMSSSLLLPEYTEPTDFWDKCAPIALLMKDLL